MSVMEPYLTQKQAAEILKVSVKTLQKLRRLGRLDFVRFGHRTIRYQPTDLARFARTERNRKERA